MADESPYHAGERQVQERVGSRALSERLGRHMIRDFILDDFRAFLAELPFVVVGSAARSGAVSASVLVGERGFVSTPSERSVRFASLPSAADPLHENLAVGAKLATLGIELATRRRIRTNGVVVEVDESGFTLAVDQSFGNCPNYILPRTLESLPRTPGVLVDSIQLGPSVTALIERADTFFVASHSAHSEAGPRSGLDISHRGGPPGFVTVEQKALIVPDYVGNNMFNTLGNFTANPTAGLLFVDFASGDLLQLTGRVELIWDGPEVVSRDNAMRAWKLLVENVRLRPASFALRELSV